MTSTEDTAAVGVTLSVGSSGNGINSSFINDRCNHPERPAHSCLTDILIRIGTDCSGMEAPIQAMRNLKLEFAHVLVVNQICTPGRQSGPTVHPWYFILILHHVSMMRLFQKPMCMWPVSHVSPSVLQDLDWVLMIKGTGGNLLQYFSLHPNKETQGFYS